MLLSANVTDDAAARHHYTAALFDEVKLHYNSNSVTGSKSEAVCNKVM